MPDSLEGFQVLGDNNIPKCYCVYILWDGTIAYIGMTENLQARLKQHAESYIFTGVFFRPCPTKQEARALERLLIWECQPKYNTLILTPLASNGLPTAQITARMTWGQNKSSPRSSIHTQNKPCPQCIARTEAMQK